MIGRADIEGSKSNVAMNSCTVSQTSYPCGFLEGSYRAGGGGGGYEDAPYKLPQGVLFICLHEVKTGQILHMKLQLRHEVLYDIYIHRNFTGAKNECISLASRDRR